MNALHSGSLSDPLRIVVLGYVVRGPIGGLTWHHLQYCVGLALMGHDVWFLEDSDDYASCYDPRSFETTTDPAYGLAYAGRVFDRFGLGDRWAYLDRHGNGWTGPAAARTGELARSADVVLNLSGVNPLDSMAAAPVRVLVDTDPVFTQVRHLHDERARSRASQHTSFATFATSVGTTSCHLPDDGFAWRPTRQPVVASLWPDVPLPAGSRFTTVMQWDSYPPVEHDSQRYGTKSASFPAVVDLPSRCPPRTTLELALGSPSAPRRELADRGWHIVDPGPLSADPWTYQQYLASSTAEFGVAKHGYAASGSGWFSERSAAYLASGRAVVTQDTGWSSWLPTGEGLFAFDGVDEAASAVEEVLADPDRHGRAARLLAVEHFDHRRVLIDLVSGV
jgi:hypothetical protein